MSWNLSAQDIHRTACQGNISRLDSLLQQTFIDVQDRQGRSLLHWTVACRQKEVFSFLMDRDITLNTEDHTNQTPLHVAVRFGRDEYFALLIDAQPNNSWVDTYGASLMEVAIIDRSLKYVEKLLDQGIDIHSVNERGSTPLEIAQRIGATDISDYLIQSGADKNRVRAFTLTGEYMSQTMPTTQPVMFAPNVVSTEESEFGSVFNKAGDEFYYAVDVNGKNDIRYSKRNRDTWSKPEVILSHDRYGYNDPFLSPDENRLYFISNRPLSGTGDPKEDIDIWYVERKGEGWSKPINAGTNINTSGNEYYISFTHDGTMYFASNINATEENGPNDQDIYYSAFVDGEFQKPVPLGSSINTSSYEADAFVAPDESYIIFGSTREEGLGRGDLYISFKNEDDSWSEAVNMGGIINTVHHELCPFVTADGKYLFYTSDQDIYWISTQVIEELKKGQH